jgi:hypothetical protein
MIDYIARGMRGARNEMIATVWLMGHGYQVFRNVSAHGPIDLIGLKNGIFEYFDVKKNIKTSEGETTRIRVKVDQARLGVKILSVFPDGRCEIDSTPMVKGKESVSCERCNNSFVAVKTRQKFCSKECSSARWKEQRRETRGNNASA